MTMLADMPAGAVEWLRSSAESLQNTPHIGLTAGLVLAVGVVCLLWGHRLLRAGYVLASMAVGAWVGVKLGRRFGVEDVIGLILGGGLAALLGHLLYRWLVAATAAAMAMLVVGAIAVNQNLAGVRSSVDMFEQNRTQAAADTEGGGASAPLPGLEGWRAYLNDLADYYYHHRQMHKDVLAKMGLVLGLAALLGLGMGLILPRFTTIIGTSLVGLAALAGSGMLLASMRWSGLWSALELHVKWILVALGAIFLLSVAFQARHSRKTTAAAPAPAA